MPDYATHHVAVVVNAPVDQVYAMFSHFNDFPKFMSFVKEVTYYDDQRSHWVAEIAGRHEWDAVNDNWVPDQQIGWRSTNGLENFGKVTFQPTSADQTQIDVFVNYNPPAGVLGDLGENLGVGSRFDNALQNDLNHFAKMVDQAPAGALDPNSSNYLFHADSAAAKGTTTQRQNETMQNDPNTGMGSSSTPNTGDTTNPDTGYTNTPNTGYSSDPNARYTNTPNTGYNTNPNAGYTDNPNTGYSTNPNADYTNNPNTGYNTNPDTRSADAQNTGYGTDTPTSDRPTLDRDITGTTNRDLNNDYGNRTSDINTGVPAEDLPPTGNREMPGY